MKITITNIDDFTPFLGKSKGADAGFEYIKKFGKLYSKSDIIKETIDKSLLLINKIVSENEPQKKTRKGKYTTAKGKYKITSRRKKGEPKSKKEEEKPAKKPKTSGSKRKKRTSTAKTETKTEKKKDEKPKTQKPTKSTKPTKEKIGEAEPWQVTLRYFATYCCGKDKTVASLRKFVKQIQATFSAKLGNKTPHIELIREIQEKLLPKANSSEKKVSLPEWSDLKKRCQEAAKDKIISKKVKRPTIVKTALSGLKKKRKSRKRSRR